MKKEEKELQEKYVQMKMLEEQLQEMQKQAQMLEKQLAEQIATAQSMEEFKKAKKGDEVLVPISSGVFIKAELKEKNSFLVNVGADTIVKKDIDTTKKMIEKQAQDMQELQGKMQMQMQKLGMQATVIQKEMQELVSKMQ